MSNSFTISGLVAKRSELSGDVHYHADKIRQTKKEIATIDAAIKLFDPDYNIRLIPSKRRAEKNKFFRNGECSRLLMDIIRDSGTPISTQDVVETTASSKGIDLEDIDRRAFNASIFTVLKRLQSRGIIAEDSRIESVIQWVIA